MADEGEDCTEGMVEEDGLVRVSLTAVRGWRMRYV